MTDNTDRDAEDDGTVDLRLTIPDVSRRRLRALSALYGCTMADLVTELISTEWEGSEPAEEERRGRRWYDRSGALHNPDGTLWRMDDHTDHSARGDAR